MRTPKASYRLVQWCEEDDGNGPVEEIIALYPNKPSYLDIKRALSDRGIGEHNEAINAILEEHTYVMLGNHECLFGLVDIFQLNAYPQPQIVVI